MDLAQSNSGWPETKNCFVEVPYVASYRSAPLRGAENSVVRVIGGASGSDAVSWNRLSYCAIPTIELGRLGKALLSRSIAMGARYSRLRIGGLDGNWTELRFVEWVRTTWVLLLSPLTEARQLRPCVRAPVAQSQTGTRASLSRRCRQTPLHAQAWTVRLSLRPTVDHTRKNVPILF